MRVGISLLPLVPGEVGGSETYVRGLVQALAAVGELEYVALLPSLAPDASGGLPSVLVPEYRSRPGRSSRARGLAQSHVRARAIRKRVGDVDIVHYPLTAPIPPLDAPSVVTLHDLQHRDLPANFTLPQRAFRAIAYDRAASKAGAVVVISEFVRERAAAMLGLDPARTTVIPLGVDHETFHPGDDAREPFLLYPANGWPHKNHERLLEAFAALHAERPGLRLLLTGAGLERLAPAPEGVELLGRVSLAELAGLYQRASCLVFPSLYEGFGLPPLEAMASGCPVAAARAGAVPETCGEAAALFDPLDPPAIAAGIAEALDRADELAAKGLERASGFTWERAARAHDAVYASVRR